MELVASEPLISDPSCIAFDERGGMFVSELHGYNIEGSGAKELFADPTADARVQKRIDLYQAALAKDRNIERGKAVFTKHCLACHIHNQEGDDVGPRWAA